MNGHLNDEQWAAAVLHEDETAEKHLAECAMCREELRSFAAAAEVARTRGRKTADQPEAFWRRQREAIIKRLSERDFVQPWKRWTWVTATVALIVLASALVSRHGTSPALTTARTDPDDAFLLSVQQSIQSDLPRALRPAALLTREIDRAEAAHGNP